MSALSLNANAGMTFFISFSSCLAPEISLCFPIDCKGFFDRLWEFDIELVGLLPVARLHLANDPVASSQHTDPPLEGRLLGKLIGGGILRYFNRIAVLQILQRYPVG